MKKYLVVVAHEPDADDDLPIDVRLARRGLELKIAAGKHNVLITAPAWRDLLVRVERALAATRNGDQKAAA